jgi:O-antigen/teichoic acid export membrane protein
VRASLHLDEALGFVRGMAVARGFGAQVASTLVARSALLVLSVATSAIVARWLGPEGKGMLALALLIPGILALFLNWGVGVANVYFAGSRRLELSALAGNSLAFTILGTALGGAILALLVFARLLDKIAPGVPTNLVLVAMLGLPFALASQYYGTILQGLRHIAALNLVDLGRGAATLALTTVAVALLGWGTYGAGLSSVMAAAVGAAWTAGLLRRRGAALAPRWQRDVWRPMLSFGLRGHIGNVLQFFNYRADMFIVNYLVGPAGVGIYSVSVAIAELLWQLPNAVGFVIFPTAAATKPSTMNAFTPRVLRITLGLTAAAAVLLAVIGRPAIEFVYSAEFATAYLPMLALLPGVVLLGGAKVLTNDIAGRGYPHLNSASTAISLTATVALDLLLIPQHGVLGAALASTAAYATMFVAAVAFYLRVSQRTGGRIEPSVGTVTVGK